MAKVKNLIEEYPPPGYVKVDSKIDGIEIYMPQEAARPSKEMVINFHCPKCGGTEAYDILNQGLQCSYCGHLDRKIINPVGLAADEKEFELELMKQARKGWGEARFELECQNCGAKVSLPPGDLSHTCAFCNSNKVIQQAAEQPSINPEFIIPFKVDLDQCRGILRNFLGGSWMVPKNLRTTAAVQSLTPIYFSFWTFDSILTAQWKAQVGHTQQERYYDSSDRTWKTRTTIVWKWENGQVQLNCDDLIISGTSRLSKRHLSEINNYSLVDLVEFEPSILAGFRALAYDVTLEKAWDQARDIMREKTKSACIDQASTNRVRNFSMTLDFGNESWRSILIPVYVAVFQYSGIVYRVLVNGQTGEISGQRPIDWQKIWLVIGALLVPGLLVSILGLITIPILGLGFLPGAIGVFLLLIGCVVSIVIGVRASQLDDA